MILICYEIEVLCYIVVVGLVIDNDLVVVQKSTIYFNFLKLRPSSYESEAKTLPLPP